MKLASLILSIFLLAGCSNFDLPFQDDNENSQKASKETGLTNEEIPKLDEKSWLFQLQNLEVKKAAGSEFSVIVMGAELGGVKDKGFTKRQIESIKEQGNVPVAYLSIGEASHYDSYWQEEWGSFENGAVQVADVAPDWLGRVPNKNWPEGVKVRYWEDEWWEIIEGKLDELMETGYEGVYLDIVDAFQYWGSEGTYGVNKEERLETDPEDEEEAGERMIEFVKKLSDYTKQSNKDFRVIPQNGENIIKYDENNTYMDAIDGIGVEDVWFNEEQPSKYTQYRLKFLKEFLDNEKFVLSVDYVDNGDGYSGDNKERIDSYVKSCLSSGFYCYPALSDRELDTTHVIKEIQQK